MRLAVFKKITDLHDTYRTLGLCYIVFSFLRFVVREHVCQLLSGDEENLLGKDFGYVIIMNGHIFFCFTEYLIYIVDSTLEGIQGTLFTSNDLFPVPLVNIYGMDIVGLLITANGAHVGVKTFSCGKTVFLECIAFPFCERLYNLSFSGVLVFDIKGYGTFDSVQIIV